MLIKSTISKVKKIYAKIIPQFPWRKPALANVLQFWQGTKMIQQKNGN